MSKIYTDNGAERGNRTRLFREGFHGGVEWTFAVDYAQHAERCRWYAYGMHPGMTIAKVPAKLTELTA